MARPRPSKRERVAIREAAARAAAELAVSEAVAEMAAAQAAGTAKTGQNMQDQQESVPNVDAHTTAENPEKTSDKDLPLQEIFNQIEERIQAGEARINQLHKENKELKAVARAMCDHIGMNFGAVVASYCNSE